MKKTGRVYKRMIITYILVLCIPILLSAVLYQYTYKTVREQSQKYNDNFLQTVKKSCDREISYYKSVLQQLKSEDDVETLVYSGTLSQGGQLWFAREIQDTMSSMIISMLDYAEYCHDIFIYFPDKDDVISMSTKTNFEYYITNTMQMDSMVNSMLMDQLVGLQKRKMIMVETKGEKYVLLTEPMWTQTGKPLNVIFGIWIDVQVFEWQVKSADWKRGIEWAFVSSEGELIHVTEGLVGSGLRIEELYETDNEEVTIGNEKYLVHTIESGAYDGKYVLLSSAELITEAANDIRNMHLLCMLVSVLLGYMVVSMVVRKNYGALERVLNILPAKGDSKNARDEFQYLENRVLDLLAQYGDTHEDMRENKRAVQDLAFERLLLPQGTKECEDVSYIKELYAKFKTGVNVVLVFSIKGCIPIENGDKAPVMENSLKRFVVANVLAEGIGEKYTQETREYDEQVVMIVNFPENEEKGIETLQSMCDKYCGFVEDNFKFRINTFAGNEYKGIKGIHYSYLEACQAENFSKDSDENFVCYNEIDAYITRKYQYSFETEETVINAVRNGNVNLANSLIDNVLEKNFRDKDKSLWRCMLYDIYTSLIKVTEEMDISISKLPLIDQAFTKETLQELQEWFHEIVDGICNKEQEEVVEEDDHKGQEFYEDVLDFIRANFKDPDLNISQIAMEFHMTPTYVSAVFKKQTGKSILDVIRQMRIEYARDLLESDMSVEDVAFAAGFRESSTFIRAFKNYHGITPGQMKKLI